MKDRTTQAGTLCALAVAGVLMASGPVSAQTGDRAAARQASDLQEAMRLKESRYQVGQMERLLEGAVEHGATVIRDRLRAMMPTDMLLEENARARGFRLDGYGVFFDVEVPSLTGTLPWSFLTLNRNNLGVDNALDTLRSFVDAAAADNVNLQQALKRIELQVGPSMPAAAPVTLATRAADGTPGTPVMQPPASLDDINEAYRSEIRDALIDAMLDHSRALNIPAGDRLTVAARGTSDDRPRLAPADSESRTVIISIRGSDLSAFLAGYITKDEARTRVDLRVF